MFKIKKIKINLYNKRFYNRINFLFFRKKREVKIYNIFDGLPQGGSFVWKKEKNLFLKI